MKQKSCHILLEYIEEKMYVKNHLCVQKHQLCVHNCPDLLRHKFLILNEREKQVSSDFVLLQTYSMADHTVKRHQITIKQMHCYCYCCWVLVNDGRAGWSRTCFSYCPLKMWQGALNQTTWSHFQEIADGLISFAQSQ